MKLTKQSSREWMFAWDISNRIGTFIDKFKQKGLKISMHLWEIGVCLGICYTEPDIDASTLFQFTVWIYKYRLHLVLAGTNHWTNGKSNLILRIKI